MAGLLVVLGMSAWRCSLTELLWSIRCYGNYVSCSHETSEAYFITGELVSSEWQIVLGYPTSSDSALPLF